jgi:hypothetical protein
MTATVLTGDGIKFAQLAAAKGAIKLERLGLKHSSGRSMRRAWALHLGLKHNTPHGAVIEELERRMRAIENSARAFSE